MSASSVIVAKIRTVPTDGFAVLLKRWIIEHTFAWLRQFRKLAKNFEILTATAEDIIRIAMLKITLAKC